MCLSACLRDPYFLCLSFIHMCIISKRTSMEVGLIMLGRNIATPNSEWTKWMYVHHLPVMLSVMHCCYTGHCPIVENEIFAPAVRLYSFARLKALMHRWYCFWCECGKKVILLDVHLTNFLLLLPKKYGICHDALHSAAGISPSVYYKIH